MSPSIETLPVQDLDSLLAQTLGKDLQVMQVEWKPLTDPGENFGSFILAINATVNRQNKTEKLNLVVKLPPRSAYLLDLFNSPVTFKKELHFYKYIASEFINLQLECGIEDNELSTITPKYFGGRLGLKNLNEFDEQGAIVLENLKHSNYTTEDRIWGLDKKHTEFAVKELAKLHAIMIALKMKSPKFFEDIALDVLQHPVNETAEKCVKDMIRKAQEDLKSIAEMKPYLEDIERTIDYSIQKNKNANKPEEPWATLVHNDFWVNNMMFRHNDAGDLVDMKIVDFQLCVYDYGIYDLIFFLISSAKKEVLDSSLNNLIDLYYESFVKFLKTLKVDTEKFSKSKFDEIVKFCGPIKFAQCIMMVQVIQASRQSASDIKNMDNDDIFVGRAGDVVCKQKLMHIVSIFDQQGWLLK